MQRSRGVTVVRWAPRIGVAAILPQTLFFKFTASEESVYIFKTLGMEPWGRIGSGIAELVAGVLLPLPPAGPLGALLCMEAMALGGVLPPRFGFAPSTLTYLNQQPCAPSALSA